MNLPQNDSGFLGMAEDCHSETCPELAEGRSEESFGRPRRLVVFGIGLFFGNFSLLIITRKAFVYEYKTTVPVKLVVMTGMVL